MIEQNFNQPYVINKKFFFFLLLVILILMISSIFLGNLRVHKSLCGNKICEIGENKENCCLDCGCSIGEECKNNKCQVVSQYCGNRICESNENCYDCPKDCKCGPEEYCDLETKQCVAPKCGNSKCEPFEGPDSCCLDCPCTIPGEICNEETQKCEMKKINISDDRVRELVMEYFQKQDKTVVSMEISRVAVWGEKIGKEVRVEIKDEWMHVLLVTEKEEVIELPAV